MNVYKIAGITLGMETTNTTDWIKRFRPFEWEQTDNLDGVIRSLVSKEISVPPEEALSVIPGKRIYQSGESQISLHVDEATHAIRYAITKNADETEHSIQFHSILKEELSELEFRLIGTLFENHAIDHGLIALQASAVETKGQAVVFIGPAGIGKSTQARLWTQTIGKCSWISDDIVCLEPTDAGIYVHTTPWSGDSTVTKNKKILVNAIVYLDQASHDAIGTTQTLERIRFLFRSLRKSGDSERSKVQLSLIEKIANTQEMVRFACTETLVAAKTLHQFLFTRNVI